MKDLSIPKLYYSISEVSRLSGIEPYVLRYWESEFKELSPQKNRAGNRIYSNRDIQFILRIKELLREQRYTIEGAKHILQSERTAEVAGPSASGGPPTPLPSAPPTPPPGATITAEELHAIRESLLSLKALLLA